MRNADATGGGTHENETCFTRESDYVAVLVVFAGAAVVLINRYAPGYSMSL